MITTYPKAMPNANENRIVKRTMEEGKSVFILLTSSKMLKSDPPVGTPADRILCKIPSLVSITGDAARL